MVSDTFLRGVLLGLAAGLLWPPLLRFIREEWSERRSTYVRTWHSTERKQMRVRDDE